MNKLVVRGLACQRGGRTLFDGFDLDVAAGEVVWLRAANGYGKTSLLRILAGLAKSETGTIAWSVAGPADPTPPGRPGEGRGPIARPRAEKAQLDPGLHRDDPSKGPTHPRPAVARPLYLAHANGLKDDLTIAESLHYLVRLHALACTPAQIDEAIGHFGLLARRASPIRTLSQGQRRRVALMHLCLSGPQTPWILDEPCDALDAGGSAIVGRLIAGHASGGGLVVLTSHVAPVIDGLRVVHLDALHDPAPR